MSVDSRRLGDLAAETGFRSETLEKVIRLGEIAADVTRHPLLSRVLVLKGGTAINLCFGAPRRLSVDLDFNYVGAVGKAEMLVERPEVERALRIVVGARGYAVQESADEHGGRKIYLGYRSAAGTPDRIEIDVNYLYRLPLGAPQPLILWQPPGFEQPTIRVVAPEELVGGKLVAFLDRAAPRDAYDVARLAEVGVPGWMAPRMRQVFVSMSIVLPHPLHTYGRARIEKLVAGRFAVELAPMLARSEHVDPDSLIERAWLAVAPLVALSANETAFVDLVNRGALEPRLIAGADFEFASVLRRHPAIAWKVENARRHGQ